ncbi:MAG: FtsX-like permease family protein [Gammaproteobacteria bacterium]|nr:MAG: FtsX-like permease family protein [Gammaproteobacteria bacterium]
MKFLPLIWSGIWRKPGRTILIFLQVSVAFALFGVLQGLKTGVQHAVDAARADLLIVHSRLSLIMEGLPISLLGPIRSVPGVRVAIPVELFLCQFQKPEQGVLSVAVTPDEDWTTAFTFAIAPQDLDAFAKSRSAALVLEATAKKYGWKIGDRIPLICRTVQKNGSPNWTFEVVGTFTDSDFGGGGDKIIMSFPYYDEARATGKGTVNHMNVSVTDPNLAVPVADAIDRLSANSSHETKTESIRELAQQQVQQIGDFDFLIRAVVSAVLAALLFAIATMMVQSVHERTSELAVLKTIGFTDRAVFMLILAEALSVCILAGAFGLALATAALPIAARVVTGLAMPKITLAIGLGFAVLVALISAAVPALFAARLRVSTALAEP